MAGPDERPGDGRPLLVEADPPRHRGLLAALVLGLALALARLIPRPGRRPPRWPGVDPEDLAAGHETSDANVGGVVATGIGLLLVLAIALIAVTTLLASFTQRPLALSPPPGLVPLPTPAPPAEPRLETEPGQQLRQYRAQQDARLHSYGWVDRPAGIVRIPIERAIDRLAQSGLPARPAAEAQQYRDHGAGSPSDASSGRVDEPSGP